MPLVPPPPPCLWDTYVDPASGHPYYTNRVTGQSVWEMPESGRVASAAQTAAAASAQPVNAAAASAQAAERANEHSFIHPRGRSAATAASIVRPAQSTIGVNASNRIAPEPNSLPYGAVRPVTVIPGDGVTYPKHGDGLAMHYTGWLRSTGLKFDSSVDRRRPFRFAIGAGEVIKGWDIGIMRT